MQPQQSSKHGHLYATSMSHPLSYVPLFMRRCIALAQRHNANVHVVHVIVPRRRYREAQIGLCEDVTERNIAEHSLEAWLGSFCNEKTRCRSLLCEGALWECIFSLINECGVDLLVLGTKGATGQHSALLGSQAEEIFREAPCPVLTIGPHFRRDGKCKFKQILFTTDVSNASMRAYSYAVHFAAESDGRLTVLHVVLTSDMRVGYDPAISDHLRSFLWAYEHPASLDVIVDCGDPLTVITRHAYHLSADLIVMGLNHATRLVTHVPWTLAHQVVSYAPCPVLTIRS